MLRSILFMGLEVNTDEGISEGRGKVKKCGSLNLTLAKSNIRIINCFEYLQMRHTTNAAKKKQKNTQLYFNLLLH